MDLVSVIIPFYKKTKYIHETVDSILKQTYQNIEMPRNGVVDYNY